MRETGNKRYEYLLKNVGILTLSNFATRVLAFILVPLYTSILSSEEYGVYDLLSNTVNLLIPILTLNIAEAVIRFALDKNSDKNSIFSIALGILLKSTVVIIVILTVNHYLHIFQPLDDYALFFIAIYVSSALQTTLSNFSRGLEKINTIAVSSVIGSAVLIGCNLIFLLQLHLGLTGYFIAIIASCLSQILYMSVATKIWRYIRVHSDRTLKKEMIHYSTPLVANATAWWVNNVSDRYVVTWLCGIAENGIYAIGGKIPTIMNVVQVIFSQAWALSAVKEFDPTDKDGFFSRLYNSYLGIMVIGCSFVILFDRPLAHLLYTKDFYAAWRYVPFLTIAIVFGAMSGYIGGIFVAVRDSKIFAKSTVIGAAVNLVLNILLVYLLGAVGAAISTVISYWLVWYIRLRIMRKYISMKMFLKRDHAAFAILIIQSLVLLWFPQDGFFVYLIEAALALFNLVLFRREIASIASKLIGKSE